MSVDSINQSLRNADQCLARISVHGDDVFALAEARKWLKLAFDKLNSDSSEKDGDDDGG